MTDTLKLKNGLIMPSNFIEVKDDEMEYLDGSYSQPTWKQRLVFGVLIAAVVTYVSLVVVSALISGGMSQACLAPIAVLIDAIGKAATAGVIIGAVGAGSAWGIAVASWC